MVRLFKGVTKILRNHMLLEEEYIHSIPDLSSLENDSSRQQNSERREKMKIANLKKGSIAYAEYREFNYLIQKLCETSELFLGVNKDLIHRENMKRGLGKGSWKSSKELREVTMIMDRTIWFFKNV